MKTEIVLHEVGTEFEYISWWILCWKSDCCSCAWVLLVQTVNKGILNAASKIKKEKEDYESVS